MPTRPFLIRLATTFVMGAVLLGISAGFHEAIAHKRDHAAFIWTTWFFATALAGWIAFSAADGWIALGRLCLLNGTATGLLLLVVVSTRPEDRAVWEDLFGSELSAAAGAPLGGVLPTALAIFALAFLAVSYFLLRFSKRRKAYVQC